LLAMATTARADEPVAKEKTFIAAVQERPKLERRDLLLFFHESLGAHNHSNVWFTVRADFAEFAFNDGLTPRQLPCIAGIKASFSF
jgi:hypothetical protein